MADRVRIDQLPIATTPGLAYEIPAIYSASTFKVTIQQIVDLAETQIGPNIIDGAPPDLDTLNELAAAIGDDADFVTTVNAAISARLLTANNLSEIPAPLTALRNLGGLTDFLVTDITASGSHVFDANTKMALVQLVGAGGAGGGAISGSISSSAGAGGNSGASIDKWILNPAGRTATIVIGAKGTGVLAGAGTDGGQSTYDDTVVSLTCPGGSGGRHVSGQGAFVAYNVGPIAVPSDVGTSEIGGYGFSMTTPSVFALGGHGASSPFGPGANNRYALTGSSFDGINGAGFGCGGGGAASCAATASATGGDGDNGICRIIEYY